MKPLNIATINSWNYDRIPFKHSSCLICPHHSIDTLCDDYQCIRIVAGLSKLENLLTLLEMSDEANWPR